MVGQYLLATEEPPNERVERRETPTGFVRGSSWAVHARAKGGLGWGLDVKKRGRRLGVGRMDDQKKTTERVCSRPILCGRLLGLGSS